MRRVRATVGKLWANRFRAWVSSAPVGHSTAEHPHVPTAPVVGPISPAVADEVDPADVTLESPVDTAWLLRKQTERRQVGEPASTN